MKEQLSVVSKLKQLSNEEIANLSDAELKTPVIRMLTELIELITKWRNEGYQSEINKNIQGTNSEGKETRAQINDLKQKEEINIQPEQNEEIIIQKKKKMRTGWGTSGTTLSTPTFKS